MPLPMSVAHVKEAHSAQSGTEADTGRFRLELDHLEAWQVETGTGKCNHHNTATCNASSTTKPGRPPFSPTHL